MQPIVLLGVAVAAVALVSTGFLNEGEDTMWNEFRVWLQQLGWGEAPLTSPISHAFVDLEVKKIVNDNDTDADDCEEQTKEETDACRAEAFADDFFDNVIQSCSFHADKNIPAPPADAQQVLNDGIIICKMLNEDGNAIAEGKRTIVSLGTDGYLASTKILIPIEQCITDEGVVQTVDELDENANCLDVQAPIHFVKLVVEDALWIPAVEGNSGG